MRVGDVMLLPNSRGDDFIVKILGIVTDPDDGKTYAEVEPVEFKSITREVPIELLKEV